MTLSIHALLLVAALMLPVTFAAGYDQAGGDHAVTVADMRRLLWWSAPHSTVARAAVFVVFVTLLYVLSGSLRAVAFLLAAACLATLRFGRRVEIRELAECRELTL